MNPNKTEPSLHGKDEKAILRKEKGGGISSLLSSQWLILLILLLAGMVWYGFYATHTKDIGGSDDREYASIARNIAEGRGIVRNLICPVEINLFEKVPLPEFRHPPGYPLIIAGSFKLFGVSDFSALLPSYLSYFFLVALFFFFARAFSGPEAAAVGAVILIFNKEILDYSLVALSEAAYTTILFLFLFLFIRAKTLRQIFMAGILLGMSQLVRSNFYPFLVPLFVYLYFHPGLPRSKKMMVFAVGILIPIIPDMVRAFLETGSPLFSYGKFMFMSYTEKYPWENIFRGIANPSLIEFFMEAPGQFVSKYLTNLVNILEQILSISNPYLLVFFLVEMFYWKDGAEFNRAKILFLFLLLSQILFIPSVNFTTPRFFAPFIPVMILFSARSFLRLSGDLVKEVRGRLGKWALAPVLFLFLIFFILPAFRVIINPSGPSGPGFKNPQLGYLISREEADRLNEFLMRDLKRNQVVWTDLPEVLEWEGDRLCGWLPTKIESLYEIRKKVPVDAVLLTNVRTPSMEEPWRYLLFSEHSLPKYREVKMYRGQRVIAKLLIRDERE